MRPRPRRRTQSLRRSLRETSQGGTLVGGQPPRIAGDGQFQPPRSPQCRRQCPQQAPSTFSWRWGPIHRNMLQPPRAKTGGLPPHRWSSLEVLVFPPLIGSSGPTTIGRSHRSMALLKTTGDGQVKGGGSVQAPAWHPHICRPPAALPTAGPPNSSGRGGSNPARSTSWAQTRGLGPRGQHRAEAVMSLGAITTARTHASMVTKPVSNAITERAWQVLVNQRHAQPHAHKHLEERAHDAEAQGFTRRCMEPGSSA